MALFAQGERIIAKEQMEFSSIICLLFEKEMSLCANVHEKKEKKKHYCKAFFDQLLFYIH